MFHVLFFQIHLNRVIFNSVFFAISLVFLHSLSYGATISNFGQWRNLSSLSKTAYIAGVRDTFLSPFEVFDQQQEFVLQLNDCLKQLNISVVEIVRMVDNFYLNKENWAFSRH